MTNSPMAGMNTSIEPAITPGMDNGNVMSRKVRHGGLPRSAAASSSEWSSFSKRREQRQHHERQVRIDDAEVDRKGLGLRPTSTAAVRLLKSALASL